jgi:tRNA-dihydrouridine synthase B
MARSGDRGRSAHLPSREIVAATAPTPGRLLPKNGNPLTGIRAVLAPLCGFTDAVFRRICLDEGADLVVTEMISSEGFVRNSPQIRALHYLDMSDGPLSLQIFGADPEVMGETAAVLSELKPRFVDINFGCPVRKIVNQNGGAAILKDRKLLEAICRRVVEKSRVPVSVKIRAGWDKSPAEHLCEIARIIEGSGVSMIAVHARTKTQAFEGKADWQLIKMVKESVSIPVVGNGDVTGADSYRRMVETTGCDAVMIGRAAIGNPWIFGEVRAAIESREYAGPTPRDRVASLLAHVRLNVKNDGEPLGLVTARRAMTAYLKRVPNAREVRARIMLCTRLNELEDMLGDFLERSAGGGAGNAASDPRKEPDDRAVFGGFSFS